MALKPPVSRMKDEVQMRLMIGNGTAQSRPSAIPAAVEEFLRYEPPLERALARWATEDVTLGGRLIRRGELVVPILAAANRDPEVFADPNELDFAREENRHLGFGRGSHYCLGAPLGRMEGEIALTTLLARLPGLRLDGDVVRWRPVSLFRGLTALPVAWD